MRPSSIRAQIPRTVTDSLSTLALSLEVSNICRARLMRRREVDNSLPIIVPRASDREVGRLGV